MNETNTRQNFDIRVYAEMWSLRLLIDLTSLFTSTCLFYIVKYLFYNPDLPESIDLVLIIVLVFHLAFDFGLTCKACILSSTETGGYELPWSHMVYVIFYDVVSVIFLLHFSVLDPIPWFPRTENIIFFSVFSVQ